MTTIVIMPGGFHPFHAGHLALYQSAVKAFPDADVYVAATDDTSSRPFPFAIKEKLAKLAGVAPGRFVQVKSPFRAEEITSKYDPNDTVLIFVKSQKNARTGPEPEGPFPAEVDPRTGKLPLVTRGARKGQPVSDRLQYYKGNEDNLQPMSRHSYLAYLPTVKFGPGMTGASDIRREWPTLDEQGKLDRVMSLYPRTQNNEKLAATVVKMLDVAIGTQGVAEGAPIVVALAPIDVRNPKKAPQPYRNQGDIVPDTKPPSTEKRGVKGRPGQRPMPKYDEDVSRRGFLRGLGAAALAGAAGSAMAQTMPNINAQQVELANKYYNALVQRAKEDGRELDTRALNFLRAKAHEAAAQKFQQTTSSQAKPQQGFSTQGSERRVAKDAGQFESHSMAEAAKKCPPATQDIALNLQNRQKAIDEYGYGPLNPDLPNTKFWMKKVDEWNLDSMEEAQQSLCGNCAAFDQRQDTLDCIAQGIDSDSPEDAEGVIDAGELGYCKFLKFKCASRRTCDAWVTGGPLVDKPVDENQGWAATYNESDDYIEEKWSAKYKSSINCANPRGFSQKAHCAGRKK